MVDERWKNVYDGDGKGLQYSRVFLNRRFLNGVPYLVALPPQI